MILTTIVLGYFIGWLWAARRNWRSWRAGGDNQMVDEYGKLSDPTVVITLVMLLSIMWPVLILMVMITSHQPVTATEVKNRAKVRERELKDAEAELNRVTELVRRSKVDDTTPASAISPVPVTSPVPADLRNTPYESTALELYNNYGLTTVTDGRGRVVRVTEPKHHNHSRWTSDEWCDHLGDDPHW